MSKRILLIPKVIVTSGRLNKILLFRKSEKVAL